jgi:hypothetical protein
LGLEATLSNFHTFRDKVIPGQSTGAFFTPYASLSLMAKTFSPSKSGWYYKVKLYKFAKEVAGIRFSGMADFVRLPLQRNVKILIETIKSADIQGELVF